MPTGREGSLRGAGTILELCSAILGLGFLAVKVMFRQWDVTDILNSRKRCQSLDELIRVMKCTEKEAYYFSRFTRKFQLSNKRKAIWLCAMLPNPRNIFSYYNSFAFSVVGEGEFAKDMIINVADLTGAGYYFGVNYYGDPIAKDANGDIQKVHFQTCKNVYCVGYCNKCARESILIAEYIIHYKPTRSSIYRQSTELLACIRLTAWMILYKDFKTLLM